MSLHGAAPRSYCPSGKVRYATESDAITGLLRVRKERVRTNDPHDHESRIYPCAKCQGWHLTSNPMLHPEDLTPEAPQKTGEPWQQYAKRLEKRIAEQRAQLLSLHALGHGGSNKDSRRRISALTVALGRMTERWENECRNREALVEKVDALIAYQQPIRRPRWLRRVA